MPGTGGDAGDLTLRAAETRGTVTDGLLPGLGTGVRLKRLRRRTTARDLLAPLLASRTFLAPLSPLPFSPAAMFGRTEVLTPDRRDGRGAASRQEREEALAGDRRPEGAG